MKRIIILCLSAMCLAGCASMDRMEVTRNAVDKGFIEGLSASNHFDAIPWSFPGKPLGPYTKLGGMTACVTNGPDAGRTYTFYLGKSKATGDWEVFSCLALHDGKWEPVPVKLPQAEK